MLKNDPCTRLLEMVKQNELLKPSLQIHLWDQKESL